MEIKKRDEQEFTVTTVAGRLDHAAVLDFDDQCASLTNQKKRVILDLSKLEYICSSGLRSILAMAKKIKNASGSLALCGLYGPVEEIFYMSGFNNVFPIYDNLEMAMHDEKQDPEESD